MTAGKPITDLLSTPLSPDWTIDGLADQLLAAIAAKPEAQDLVLDAEAAFDPQSRRLIRPLLACLATKSGAENGIPVNLYGGEIVFKRRGPEGPIWILVQFENKPGSVRAAFRRSAVAPDQAVSCHTAPSKSAEQVRMLVQPTVEGSQNDREE